MTPVHIGFRALALVASLTLVATVGVSTASAAPVDDLVVGPSAYDESTRTVETSTELPITSAPAGLVTGTLRATTSGGLFEFAVANGSVQFYTNTYPYEFVASALTNSTGGFSFAGLPAGTYNVSFISRQPPADPVREWYNQQPFQFVSTPVTLTEGTPFSFGTIVLGERAIAFGRIAGADRFETAVLASGNFLRPPSPHVYIVNGLDFPDALSAGALAARQDVLLLVKQNSIPTVVHDLLDALNPSGITIVGGTSVVSAAVQTQLQAYVTSPSLVTRIAGTDRYDTSRRVVAEGYEPSSPSIFVATGRSFPDALSAVPAAGVTGGVVLLVNGSLPSLDPTTQSFLQRLSDERGAIATINVIGGEGVVSPGIFNDLEELAADVNRYSGADRYATAVEVARGFFPNADIAYVASGANFPDALAAGPVAAQLNSPIYLSRPNCLPNVVALDILDVLANGITLVGGTSVLTDQVFVGPRC